MTKKTIFFLFAGLVFVVWSNTASGSIGLKSDQSVASEFVHTITNPSAFYCTDLGYQYQITSTETGQGGLCIFDEGESCEAWDFYSGKCGQEYSWCLQHGYGIKSKSDGKDGVSTDYAVCTVLNTIEIGSVSQLAKLDERNNQAGCSGSKSEIDPSLEPKSDMPIYSPEKLLTSAFPQTFDWRNAPWFDGYGDWMTPVKNQGYCGSCWAFSAVGVAEAALNIGRNSPLSDPDLSEQYLVSDCEQTEWGFQNCCGGWKDESLAFIRDFGIPDEGCMPYVDGAWDGCSCDNECENCTYRTEERCSDRTCSDRCADYASRSIDQINVARVYSPTNQVQLMKDTLINVGPLAVSLGIGWEFGGSFDSEDTYRCTQDRGSNHAVVITGYDDVGQRWIVRNSWGSDWEDEGYYKVGYGECGIEDWVYVAASNPFPFEKHYPAENAVNQETPLILDWGDSIGAYRYRVCVDTTNDDACDENDWYEVYVGEDETFAFLTNLAYDTTYYWQVKVRTRWGYEKEAHGGWWQFTTKAEPPPARFGKSAPANRAVNLDREFSLSWQNAEDAAYYEVCLDQTNDQSCDDDNWIPVAMQTSYALSDLTLNNTYYWQVRAINGGGVTTADDGTWWRFTVTSGLPKEFVKWVPNDTAIGLDTDFYLTWSSSDKADSYQYCISKKYGECNNWISLGTAKMTHTGQLRPATTYYWQVRAVNEYGWTEANQGHWWRFETKPYQVMLPLLIR